MSAVVSAAYTPPATSYADNGDTLAHVGRTWEPEHTTARDALHAICAAVYGRFWIARDGTATYWSRTERQNPSATPALTVTASDPLEALDVGLDVESVINRAQVTVYPVETVWTLQTLWQAQTTLRLAPGQTRVIYAPFRDENGERCGAVEVVTPVATTDYAVNTRSDGSGTDFTGSAKFSISTTTEATRMQITLGNSANRPLYVTLLKVRGKPLRTYDPITVEVADTASQSAYEVRAHALDLSMQPDPVFGQSYAEYLVGRFAQPALSAARLVVQDRAQIGSVSVWALDLMDKIVISESASGLNSAGHWIRALEYAITPARFTVTAHLERADARQYWLLGRTGYSALDSETRLGF